MATGSDIDQKLNLKSTSKSYTKQHINSTDYNIVHTSPVFVDKTLLIKAIFDEPSPYHLITMPVGYGKSTNLDMVRRFVEMNIDKTNGNIGPVEKSENFHLFQKNKLISEEKLLIAKHFATFVTINIGLQSICKCFMNLVLIEYSNVLSNLYLNYMYLLESPQLSTSEQNLFRKFLNKTPNENLSKRELAMGIPFLAEMLLKHNRKYKIFLFIDDYDFALLQIITNVNTDDEFGKEFLSFFQDIFNTILSNNNIFHRILITGRTSLGAIYFPKNCPIKISSFLRDHPFEDYYGITRSEFTRITEKNKLYPFYNIMCNEFYSFETLQNNLILPINVLRPIIFPTRLDTPDMEPFAHAHIRSLIQYYLYSYFMLKSSTGEWFPCHNIPYSTDTILRLRDAFTRKSNQRSVSIANLSRFLIELGWFRIKKAPNDKNKILVKMLIHEDCEKIIRVNYLARTYETLNSSALHLSNLSIFSDARYFDELGKNLEGYFNSISRAFYTNNGISEHMFGIIGKSNYCIMLDYDGAITDGIFIENDLAAVICKVTFNVDLKSSLKKSIEDNVKKFGSMKSRNYIFMSINVKYKTAYLLKASFGILVNSTDFTKAVYY